MPNLLIDDIEPGMVLADDVADPQGRPLLKGGVDLTEKHIKVFKIWGVSQVSIVGEDTAPALQEIIDSHPELINEAEETAKQLFQHVDHKHPFFKELMPKCVQHYLKIKAEQL